MAEQPSTLETELEAGRDAVPSEPSPPPPQARKVWHAGTLTYTGAALAALFFWLLWGDFSLMLKERSVPASLQLLLKKFQAPDKVIGILIGSLPAAIGIVLGPIISYRSDRRRGRWGRRIPYLLIPTPVAMLSMVGLGFSPALGAWIHERFGLHSIGLNACIVVCLGFFWTLFEICSIICSSVFTGLINDVVPRELLGRFFALFRIFSLAAGMLWTKCLLDKFEDYYRWIFIGIGALYLASFTAMCLMVKEGTYPDPPPADPSVGPLERFFKASIGYFRDCFSHPYYRWFFLSMALSHICFLPINMFYMVFAKSMDPDLKVWGWYLTVQLGVSLVQAYPVGWLCDKFHPIRVTMLSLALIVLSTFAAFLFVSTPLSLGITLVVCGSLAGFWGTATSPLPATLLPRAKYATFYSAMQVSTSVAAMIASPLIGTFLDWRHHDYRYIYLWCSLFAFLSLAATVVVYRKFKACFGPEGYVAPE